MIYVEDICQFFFFFFLQNFHNFSFQTKIRPKGGQIEMEMGLRTRGPTYDRSKGEQIALNVDGAFRDKRDSEDNFYKRY